MRRTAPLRFLLAVARDQKADREELHGPPAGKADGPGGVPFEDDEDERGGHRAHGRLRERQLFPPAVRKDL